jgi:leucyl-tRNA synthetase
MKGKRAMFPFGFHCTGMPIKASADKLAHELDTGVALAGAGGAKGAKAQSKSVSGSSQADILRHMQVPEDDIPQFRDPRKWLQFFPPLGVADLKLLGCCIDWRRSFITAASSAGSSASSRQRTTSHSGSAPQYTPSRTAAPARTTTARAGRASNRRSTH